MFIASTGSWILGASQGAGHALLLLLRTFLRFPSLWFRRGSIFTQMFLAGVMSVPVVILVALFSGWIVALQTGVELRNYGAHQQIGTLVTGFMVRGWGPVMTAFILAGRVGSAMAAELGTMRVSEEVDALEVMGIDPLSYLVFPRFVSLALMGPILTIYATVIGVASGALVAIYQLEVPWGVYLQHARAAVEQKDVIAALVKASTYGVVVSIVGCSQGLRAVHGAEDVGRATRNSVVVSFVMILILEYLISWAFYGAPEIFGGLR
ncbi:MAG: ABC transporter permease [Planctomycetota bacterium]